MKIAKTVILVGYQSGIVEKEKLEASKTSVVMTFFFHYSLREGVAMKELTS